MHVDSISGDQSRGEILKICIDQFLRNGGLKFLGHGTNVLVVPSG